MRGICYQLRSNWSWRVDDEIESRGWARGWIWWRWRPWRCARRWRGCSPWRQGRQGRGWRPYVSTLRSPLVSRVDRSTDLTCHEELQRDVLATCHCRHEPYEHRAKPHGHRCPAHKHWVMNAAVFCCSLLCGLSQCRRPLWELSCRAQLINLVQLLGL